MRRKPKNRLRIEVNITVTNYHGLKMTALKSFSIKLQLGYNLYPVCDNSLMGNLGIFILFKRVCGMVLV